MYGSEIIKNKRDREDNNRKILLRMENIGKSFSGVKVLDDVSFDLKSGEIHILAEEMGIPFECYDYRTPEEIEKGLYA